jgi:hypothetical protein
LISLFFSTISFAQEKLIFGFDAGSLIAGEHRTDKPVEFSYILKPDYLFGIEAGYGFSDDFALRLQIFIDQRTVSSRQKQTFEYIEEDSVYNKQTFTSENESSSEYLEIPLTAKYNFFSGRSHGYLFAGPVIAFNTEHTGAHANFGIVGGAGYSRDLTHIVTFFAETGYTVGLANQGDTWVKVFTRDFRINTGLLFNIALPIEY